MNEQEEWEKLAEELNQPIRYGQKHEVIAKHIIKSRVRFYTLNNETGEITCQEFKE